MFAFGELPEIPFERDYFRAKLPPNSAFYKPIKLRKVYNQEHFEDLGKEDFCRLPYKYGLKNDKFLFQNLDPVPLTRFIELLASLTLYHFSKSSKNLYYECLDIRGLDCSGLGYLQDDVNTQTGIDGFDGKVGGFIRDANMRNYVIYYSSVQVNSTDYITHPTRYNFVKKMKNLELHFELETFEEHMTAVCNAFFQPTVEYASLEIGDRLRSDKRISLDQFSELFNYCKNLKILRYHDELFLHGCVDSPFLEVKHMVETWSMSAVNLEVFMFHYQCHHFQLDKDKNKLRRCVYEYPKWYWTDECDIDNVYYLRCMDFDVLEKLNSFPSYFYTSFYDDMFCCCKNPTCDQLAIKPGKTISSICVAGQLVKYEWVKATHQEVAPQTTDLWYTVKILGLFCGCLFFMFCGIMAENDLQARPQPELSILFFLMWMVLSLCLFCMVSIAIQKPGVIFDMYRNME